MHLANHATYQRLRMAPSVMATPDRIKSSLEQAKVLVALSEADADSDTRGSQAIEKKNDEHREKSGSNFAEDDEQARLLLEKKFERQALDLYVQYLRSVFHICFYCVCVSDCKEELVRKCVGHVRRAQTTGKNAKQNEASWLKTWDEKIQLLTNRDGVNPLDYGGENYQE